MKCFLATIPIFLILFTGGFASAGELSPGDFPVNKRMVYHIHWNGIPVGSVTAESGEISEYRGKKVYTLKLVTESNRFLSAIYRVEDTYYSLVDKDTMTSLRYEADRKEGSYRKHVIVEYDFDKMEAVYTSITDGSVKRCPIPRWPQDPMSAICYFMSVPAVSGDEVCLVVTTNEKNYSVCAGVGEERKMKIPAMAHSQVRKVTLKVYHEGKEFKKGKAWAYISADSNRYPVYGAVSIPFGIVTAVLVKVEDI